MEEEGKREMKKGKDLTCLLLALKIEEKGHEPRNVAASNENNPHSFYSQQENRDCGPTTSRN